MQYKDLIIAVATWANYLQYGMYLVAMDLMLLKVILRLYLMVEVLLPSLSKPTTAKYFMVLIMHGKMRAFFHVLYLRPNMKIQTLGYF